MRWTSHSSFQSVLHNFLCEIVAHNPIFQYLYVSSYVFLCGSGSCFCLLPAACRLPPTTIQQSQSPTICPPSLLSLRISVACHLSFSPSSSLRISVACHLSFPPSSSLRISVRLQIDQACLSKLSRGAGWGGSEGC